MARRIPMASDMVRIRRETHARLKDLAEISGKTMTDVLDQAVEDYERRAFLDALNDDFAALRANTGAWKEELAERAAWDATLADDLKER
jgi:hypothetical protein